MTQGRKKLAPAEQVGPEFVGATPEAMAEQEAARNRHLAVVSALVPGGAAYDCERLISESRFLMDQAAEAMLGVGQRLIAIKEHEPHGAFLDIVQDRLGLGIRTAQQAMAAAARYLGPALANTKAQALAHLGKAKMLDLMVLDDEQLVALGEGETVDGLKLDKIERMTTRELRAELRKLQTRSEDLDDRIKTLTDQNEEAQQQLSKAKRRWRAAKPDEQRADLERAVNEAALAVRVAIATDSDDSGLRGAVKALSEHAYEHNLDVGDFLGDVFGQLLTAVRVVRDDERLPIAIPLRQNEEG